MRSCETAPLGTDLGVELKRKSLKNSHQTQCLACLGFKKKLFEMYFHVGSPAHWPEKLPLTQFLKSRINMSGLTWVPYIGACEDLFQIFLISWKMVQNNTI